MKKYPTTNNEQQKVRQRSVAIWQNKRNQQNIKKETKRKQRTAENKQRTSDLLLLAGNCGMELTHGAHGGPEVAGDISALCGNSDQQKQFEQQVIK